MKKTNYGHAMKLYRAERWLYLHRMTLLAKVLCKILSLAFNCSIPYTCAIGERVNIAHSIGIVIHQNAEIGEGTIIYQNVTIGNANGPKIGRNCVIGCGAVILGDIKIGDNVKIGANAVVLQDVPDGATVVGVPATVVKMNGVKVER